jgi:hypothetical protein
MEIARTSRSKHGVGAGRIRRIKNIAMSYADTSPRRIDVIWSSSAARPAIRIDEVGVVENIEEFGPELRTEQYESRNEEMDLRSCPTILFFSCFWTVDGLLGRHYSAKHWR